MNKNPTASTNNSLNNQLALTGKEDVLPRIDAATILASLNNAPEVVEAQASLEALKSAVASGDKTKLVDLMVTHSALLSALSERLLADAHTCKSEELTVTILELALKSFSTTAKTVLATNALITTPAPVVAVQIKNV
jgi:hypothetical protein